MFAFNPCTFIHFIHFYLFFCLRSHWDQTSSLMREHGIVGVAAVSALPVLLQPIALFAVLSGMNLWAFVAAVFVGRTIKYFVFGYCALKAPRMLRVFGISQDRLASFANSKTE
jgi:membrane protein YqaA with SNARE-associated domain